MLEHPPAFPLYTRVTRFFPALRISGRTQADVAESLNMESGLKESGNVTTVPERGSGDTPILCFREPVKRPAWHGPGRAVLLAARGGAAAVKHRLATPSKRRRRVHRGGKDALQRRHQNRLTDVRPAAPHLGQGGISAASGVGTLNGEKVGGGGHDGEFTGSIWPWEVRIGRQWRARPEAGRCIW